MEPEEPGYPGAAVAGAVLATICFPFISLIVALLLQGGQTDARKRAQLRAWAWASGGWVVVGVVLVVLLAGIGTGSGSGP